ncbi:Cytochrome c [Pirellulimonas nuda]|uniref:Cytochrome c n=1 Tax=Pirellulimonas nuda TaxID=2528009 RepID=A0A518D7F5_9BACT|nr:cytochrome c [Pirellulimonas nuda]QDU87414.1 Cytochrome c [Pirellulimonas nuda]
MTFNRLPCLLTALVLAAAGCAEPEFSPDRMVRVELEPRSTQNFSATVALRWLFGAPAEPRIPAGSGLDPALIERAAGSVETQKVGHNEGLYRQHCVRCHGVTGNGLGPAALYQAPYPRDFRKGIFKWKSTYRGQPPTVDDLMAVLEHGVPGTAMPSFANLPEDERRSLAEYVRYLAIRGQSEQAIVYLMVDSLDDEESLDVESNPRHRDAVQQVVAKLDARWRPENLDSVTPHGDRPATPDSVARGRELFLGKTAACSTCHVDQRPRGDRHDDYDDWSKPVWELAGERDRLAARLADMAPTDSGYVMLAEDVKLRRQTLKEALPPRPVSPRVFPVQAFHGGGERVDLFRRVHQGIAGTPMPAAGPPTPAGEGVLSEEELWCLVDYIQSTSAAWGQP